MFCSQCGKELRDNASICPSCGHRVRAKVTQKNQRSVTPAPSTSESVLYESKGYPQAYYRKATVSGLIAIVGGALFALISQAKHHSSQMTIYANGTPVHSGTLGGGSMFTAEGQQFLLILGIICICAGVFVLYFAQKQKGAFALTLYETRIEGTKSFQNFVLEYGQVTEVLSDTSSVYQAVTIITSNNKHRVIVTHDADQAAKIIRAKVHTT